MRCIGAVLMDESFQVHNAVAGIHLDLEDFVVHDAVEYPDCSHGSRIVHDDSKERWCFHDVMFSELLLAPTPVPRVPVAIVRP